MGISARMAPDNLVDVDMDGRLRNAFPLRYGPGIMIFRVGRVNGPGHRPATLVGHSGATGTWLLHYQELDLHRAGTVDEATCQRAPLSRMTEMVQALS